ncbi:MAG TPA: hypothetical protein ACFE0H_11150 [Elainellaceae cyanobacterium]
MLIIPDRSARQEKFYVEGRQNAVIPTVTQTLANHQLLYNRDVGEIVGQPAPDWYRAQIQRRKLVIVFRDKEQPPWRREDGARCREATYSIPDYKIGLSWQEIKRAAKFYVWGKFRATANLENGRQMAVYGATASGAKDKLEELHQLCTSSIVSLNVSEEVITLNPPISLS